MATSSTTTTNQSPTNKPLTKQQQEEMSKILEQFNKMRTEQRLISQKLAELDSDANEHRLVIETLKKVSKDRCCYRMIGGILLQQTVEDVLPDLEQNNEMLKKTIQTFQENLKTKGKAIMDFVQKHKLAPLLRQQINVPLTMDPTAATNTSGSSDEASTSTASSDKKTSTSSVLVE